MENIDDQVARLLRDDRLINWVLSPDVETNAFWEQWMKDNPDGITALFRARGIVHDLAYTQRPDNAQEMADSIWNGIESSIAPQPAAVQPVAAVGSATSATAPLPSSKPLPADLFPSRHRRPLTTYLLAASFAGLLFLGGRLFWSGHTDRPAQPEQKVANLLVHQDLDRVNQTDRNQVVYLVDGSKVILQPGAGIRYAAFLQKDKREVYLKGNAFFDVAKDARRPFFVYSGDLVVHVLGTSFAVSTDKNTNEISILVKTGKVAVSTRQSANADGAQQPLILVQDQKFVYKKQHIDWAPVAVNSQDLIPEKISSARAISFDFEETPVISIFQTLENAYGIPLHYDEKTFSKCIVTTSLSDEPFEEKLKIICAAIGAGYRIDEEGVSIEGKPCK